MLSPRALLAASALALVLSACSIGDPVISARTDFDRPVLTTTIAPGETKSFTVVVPSWLRSISSRLVIDAVNRDQPSLYPFDIVLYDTDMETPLASTAGPFYFMPGLDGLGRGFSPQASGSRLTQSGSWDEDLDLVERSVSIASECWGACVSRSAPQSLASVTVDVTNVLGSPVTLALYAVVETYTAGGLNLDLAEPANDSQSGAATVTATTVYQGLIDQVKAIVPIEVLDEDWLWFSVSGNIKFDALPGFGTRHRMGILSSDGDVLHTLWPGDDAYFVLAGSYGRVRTDSQDPRLSVYGSYSVYF